MINLRLCRLALLAILFMGTGCAVKPQQSALLGECKKLLVPHKVWEGREEAFVGSNLLTAIEVDSVSWSRKRVVGTIDAGTQVRITKVLRDWNGSWGNFLRVQVEIIDGPFRGAIAEVPSIAPYHPTPSWIVEYTLDPNALQFNPDLVRPCDS